MQQSSKVFLTQILATCRSALLFVGLFSLFINVLMLTVPLYMLQLFDRVLASHSYATLFFLTLIAITALLVLSLLDMARARILVRTSHWLDNKLSPSALQRSADEILQGRRYGSQALRDITTVRQFLGGAGIFALFDSPWVPIYIFVIFLLHPALGFLATAGAISLFCIAITNELVTRKPLNQANAQALQSQQRIDATMRNAEVIQAMGMMPNIVKHWFADNEPALGLQSLASNRAGVLLAISKFVRLSLQLLMLGTGAYLVIQNQLTAGGMIAGSILLSRALAPVEQAIGVWKQLISARQAYHRLKNHFAIDTVRTAGITLPKPTGQLQLENVYYAVPGMKQAIINGLSCHIKAGEALALIGPSGAGKSTLARLLVGALKPNAGNIRLDGADVYTWDRPDFGSYIGYLPQDVELFTGTVKANIARMGDIDDEAVIQAAQFAGVHETILKLPNGYDTEIQGLSFELSGGQRQRVALARALYKQPCLVILDEPNANLDNEGEQALLQALRLLKARNTTVILIAHKPSIVEEVDQILVLHEGRIQLAGPPKTVLQQLQSPARTPMPVKLHAAKGDTHGNA